MVGERPPVVTPRDGDALAVEEGRQLPDVVRLDSRELGQVVRDHRCAGTRRNDDGRLARERADEGPPDTARGAPVPGIEGRLPAADLPSWELDLVAGPTEKQHGVGDRLRKDEVPETGGKELDAPAHFRERIAS